MPSRNSSTDAFERHSIQSSSSSLATINPGTITTSTLTLSGHTLSGDHATKTTTKEIIPSTESDFMVDFENGDPENPLNWSLAKRWMMTMVAGFIILNCTIASSIPSGVLPQIQDQFGFSREVGSLCLSLFVLGFAVGPILWGPMSEDLGRQPVSLVSLPLFVGTQVGCALSPNTACLLVFRFLGGVFGASYLTTSGGIIADMFDGELRGKALGAFTLIPFAGPSLSPLISGWMSMAGVDWQWVFWSQAIYGVVCLFLVVIAQPETYKPVLLVYKAQRKRKATGDSRWWALPERQHRRVSQRIRTILTKPFVMLATEPMLLALTIYLSFAYGIIYLLFEAYPIVFGTGHHFNAGVLGLTYLPVPIGGLIACTVHLLYFNPKYIQATRSLYPLPPPAEYRLPISLYGAVLLPISFFWFGWTSFPSVPFWIPIMAGVLLGLAVVLLYLGLYSYMFDVYANNAASALAVIVISRSLFGAVFPLFATQMYEELKPQWASTLLGVVSLFMTPVPFVLQKYGPVLRARSTSAPKKPTEYPEVIVPHSEMPKEMSV